VFQNVNCSQKYLVSDLDKQEKNDDDEQIVKDADGSDDEVDDLEYKVTDVGQIVGHIVRFEQRSRDVLRSNAQQRCVLHRGCCQLGNPFALYISCWSNGS